MTLGPADHLAELPLSNVFAPQIVTQQAQSTRFLKALHARIMHYMNLQINLDNPSGEFARLQPKMHNVRVNNVSKYRDLRGWTQQQLAEVVGVTQSTIQRAEAEHPSAKLTTYKACAEALGVTLADLFANKRADLEDQVIEILRRFPKENQADLFDLLEAAKTLGREADE